MSFRLRLMLLVAALVVLLLGGLGLYLRASLEPWAIEALDRELELRADALADHLEVKRSGELEEDEEDDGSPDHGAYEVQDATGAILVGRGLERLHPIAPGVWPARTLQNADGQAWRVYSRAISPEHQDRLSPERRPLRVIVGAPAARFAQVSARFELGLGASLLLGLLLGGLGAALIAQLSSAPIRRLSSEVATIELSSIDRRVSLQGLDPELGSLAKAVNDLLDRLGLAFEQQRALVSRASHALRTPIASMLSISEVSLRRERSVDEYRQALVETADVARGAAVLVQQILALGRADVLKGSLVFSEVQLGEVGAELGRLFAPRVAQAGVDLALAIPETLVVWADRARLRELLEALLDNALRYTPRGGKMGLTGDASPEGPVLHVWDTGPGIGIEDRERVFERFYRGRSAVESGQPGTGLGLSIARAIAEAHGAQLTIEDRPAGGVSFRLSFGRFPGSAGNS